MSLKDDIGVALRAIPNQLGAWTGRKNPDEGFRAAVIQNCVVVGTLALASLLIPYLWVLTAIVAVVKIKNLIVHKAHGGN